MVFSEEELMAFEQSAKEANKKDLAFLKKNAFRVPLFVLTVFGSAYLQNRAHWLIMQNSSTGALRQFWPYLGVTIAICSAFSIVDWRKSKLAKKQRERPNALELGLLASALWGAALTSYLEMYQSDAASVNEVVFAGAFLIAGRACFFLAG